MSDENERTHKVGPHTLKTATPKPTTAELDPTYAVCTPDRWGMRYSDRDPDRPGRLMYPLARDYAREIHALLLNQIQWGNAYFGPPGATPSIQLTWPIDNGQLKQLFALIRPIMADALTSNAGRLGINSNAIPDIAPYTPTNPLEQGAFSMEYWRMQITFQNFKTLIQSGKEAEREKSLRGLQTRSHAEFADTIYHESRHCQQDFWIFALIQQHPDNFDATPNITKWLDALGKIRQDTTNRPAQIISVAAKTPLPEDTAALISLKRMAVGIYTYYLDLWRKQGYWPPYMSGLSELEREFQQARTSAIDLLQNVGLGGTSIDVDGMLGEPPRCICGYTERPWENNAFFCGDMATAYWQEASGNALETHSADECSKEYALRYRMWKRNGSYGSS